MIVTAHQPVYLPWLGLFHKIALSDTFVVLDAVQYVKNDWNNRNKIKAHTGPIWLTTPVFTKGRFKQSLREVRINNTFPWRRKHLKSLQQYYIESPYFDYYIPFFKDLYSKEWDYLVDLDNEILRFLLDELGINVEIVYSHDLDLEGRKSDLVLNMCEKLNADVHIFGYNGRDYAEVEEFESKGIKVYFQDYKHPKYPQQFGDFLSHLSVVDLLFNCGKDSFKKIMEGNIKKEDLMKMFVLNGKVSKVK